MTLQRALLVGLGSLILLPLGLNSLQAQQEGRLLRFPAIYNEKIVFSYAGDLYWVSRSGGTARKLTQDKGYEMFPRFSPDGQRLAFTAQYHGNTEVYTMPADGGTPRRLTYTATLDRDDVADRMGPNNIVMTWTPDGDNIVYRSRRYSFNAFKGRLFQAPLDGGMSQEMPLSVASWCSYSPDGSKLAYNETFREFRTWKYYRGGMAGDIYIYDQETESTRKITDSPAQDIFPMWHKDKIYFCSDRNNTMNIFAYDLESEEVTQVTDFTKFDVKYPSIGPDAIVFQNGGYIYLLNLQTMKTRKVTIQLADDEGVQNTQYVDASKQIEGVQLSPEGQRVAMSARGDLFNLPARKGVTQNLSRSEGSHERAIAWSPDGEQLAFISDRTGEERLYVQPAGGGQARPVTEDLTTYNYGLEWSPDGEYLLWSDRQFRLRMVAVASGEITEVDQSEMWEIRNYEWSPDGQWIAYTMPKRKSNSVVKLYSLEEEESYEVTEGFYGVGGVNFSRDGQYLLFNSQRSFDPIYSRTEWNHAYVDMSKPYLLLLDKDTPHPLKPENPAAGETTKEKQKKEEEQADEQLPEVSVDLAGLGKRIVELPVTSGRYSQPKLIDGKVYYLTRQHHESQLTLKMYNLAQEEEKALGDYDGFQVARNGKRVLVKQGDDYYVEDWQGGEIKTEHKLDQSGLKMMVNRQEEYRQIFEECWRQMRAYFYDPGMHGVDWPAVREKYAPLVSHVAHRNDLTYVIGEMIGELNAGHAYVGGGDRPEADRIKMGLLGARFSAHESGYFRIDSIIPGANWRDKWRSPLQDQGADVQEGEYILAINGRDLRPLQNIYEALIGTGGELVELTVNDEPEHDGARKVLVKTLESESSLYYYNWVETRREKVNKATDGRVGYIHLPNMVQQGLNMFARYYYPQLRKEGLIVDVRGNGGGNVSPMIIERLDRTLAMVNKARGSGTYPSPGATHVGPKACLLDRYTASDGDLFAYRFRLRELGPLVGERSWGGVVGIRGSLPLIDGGYLRKPEFAKYDRRGDEWIIEGHGVEPDIKVHNNPLKAYQGKDQQLQEAIKAVQERMEAERTDLPEPPPYPDKSRQQEAGEED